MAAGMAPASPPWAIIDIGSNSVRLVIYDGPAATPLPIHNEKILCGLGKRDAKTGALRTEAVDQALAVLARYKELLDIIRPERTVVFATAAARDAANGPAFLEAVAALGLSPTLISGDEEARLAALGVLSAAPAILQRDGGGVSGDIGGGSLELCHICSEHDKFLGPRISLPLGGLRLATEFGDDLKASAAFIDRTLDSVEWLGTCGATSFHIVGGAWRALARIAMHDMSYPLEILDHFQMSRRDVKGLCARAIEASVDDLAGIPGIQRRRAPTLPHAAIVLRGVFDRLKPEHVVVSSCGVREGVIFDRLPTHQQAIDPLGELMRYLAQTAGASFRPDTQKILRFLKPGFAAAAPLPERLWDAAVAFCQASLTQHPELRAELAANTIMGLPLRGVTHRDRALLASALFFRHGGRSSRLYKVVPTGILDDAGVLAARQMGLGLRFVLELDPTGGGLLNGSALAVVGDELVLSGSSAVRKAWGIGPAKRFNRFAEIMGFAAATEKAE